MGRDTVMVLRMIVVDVGMHMQPCPRRQNDHCKPEQDHKEPTHHLSVCNECGQVNSTPGPESASMDYSVTHNSAIDPPETIQDEQSGTKSDRDS